MNNPHPYRAWGTFEGPSYVERAADRELLKIILDNRSYAYFLAPRQSGKSSLIHHTIKKVDGKGLKCIFVDLTELHREDKQSYDTFLGVFLGKVFRSLEILGKEPFNELNVAFDLVERTVADRVVVFLDEIDWLRNSDFKDDFLSNIRAIFNARPGNKTSNQVQFILSGAVPSTLLISDEDVSPFNVAARIELQDLSLDELKQLARPLDSLGVQISGEVAEKLKVHTNGSVFLSQLILDRFWEHTVSRGNSSIDVEAIDRICDEIVSDAERNPHFQNIKRMVSSNPERLREAQDYLWGKPIDSEAQADLFMTGLFDKGGAYRNRIYKRVFGLDGTLALFRAMPSVVPTVVPGDESIVKIKKAAKKLLITYSDDDRDVAFMLRQALLESGYDVWIAHENMRGSVLWTQTILAAIDNADGIVLLWSSNAQKSRDVHEEIRIARVFGKPIFPVLARPMDKIPSLPDEIRALQVIHERNFDLTIAELKARLSDPIRSYIKYPELAQNGYIPKPPNPYFVGRNSELKDLFVETFGFHGESKKGIPIAVSGLAGIGKTHLALTFAYRFNLFFSDGVYWVDTPNGIVQEFEKIGNHLGINRLKEELPLDYASKVYKRLGQLGKSLVIFDNVTDIPEFRKWCPVGSMSCSVILTTRKSPRGFAVRVMNLTELDADSAYKLIIARRKDGDKISADKAQQQALQRICDIMGNHPLALELCACYLQSDFVQPTDFLHDIERDPLGHLASQPQFQVFLDQGNATLLDVLAKNYDSLNREIIDPYFLLMCWFAPHGINTDLIMKAYDQPREGARALDELAENSLLYRETQKTFSLHPLVAQFGRSLAKTQSADYHQKFVEVIVEFLQTNRDSLSSEQVRAELPHVFEAIEVSREHGFWDLSAQLHIYCAKIVAGMDKRIELLNGAYQLIEEHLPHEKRKLLDICVQLGKAYRTKEQFKEALAAFDKARTLHDELSEVDPGEIAALQFELGDAYLALGHYEEARKRLTRALEIALTVASYDVTAPEVTRIKQALAKIDLFLGSFSAAEKAFREVLMHREQFYAKHPDAESSLGIGSSYADLSQLALERGNYKEAIVGAEKALAIIREHHKDDDSACGSLFLLLGTIHYVSGNYGLAKEQIENAQRIFLSTFGEKHPSYARTLVALGELSRKLGKFGPALEKTEQAIKIFEDRYGEIHPSVAEALEVQGKIYDHLCEFVEEEKVWNRILDIQSKVYPENHPASAITHYHFGNLCLRRGEFDDALKHLEKSLSITEKSLGKNHSHYFGRLILLAACYYEQQKYSRAEETLREAQSLQRDIFGESPHPYIARMLQLQSEVDRRLGNFEKALASIDQAIEMKEEIYDREHPSVAEVLEVKVDINLAQFRVRESKELLERIERIQKLAYGEKHPAFLNYQLRLAEYHSIAGQYREAQEVLKKSLKTCYDVFASDHPEIIKRQVMSARLARISSDIVTAEKRIDEAREALGNRLLTEKSIIVASVLTELAYVKRKQSDYKNSLIELEKAVEIETKVFGTDSPGVIELLVNKVKLLIVFHRLKDAEQIIESTMKSVEGEGPIYKRLRADLLDQRGILETYRSQFDKAIKSFDEALDLKGQVLDKTNAEFAKLLVDKAVTLMAWGKYQDALDNLEEAQNINNPLFKDDHVFFARICLEIGLTYYCKKSYVAAKEQLEEALKIYQAPPKQELREHASTLEALGLVYLDTGFASKASQLFGDALEIKKSIYDSQHPEIAATLYNEARALLKMAGASERRGKPQDPARQKLEEALQILKSNKENGIKRLQEIENTLLTL